MPKDSPKMAGTMMKTNSRVNHTVKEMPSRIHTKLSNGLKKSSILSSCGGGGGGMQSIKLFKIEGKADGSGRQHFTS